MAKTVDDTLGRRLQITLDFGSKRIFVTRLKEGQAPILMATLDVKQALKMAAIIVDAVRHIFTDDLLDG